jgi:hypothetical protein
MDMRNRLLPPRSGHCQRALGILYGFLVFSRGQAHLRQARQAIKTFALQQLVGLLEMLGSFAILFLPHGKARNLDLILRVFGWKLRSRRNACQQAQDG